MKTWTKEELEAEGYTVENNILKSVDVNVVAHFGNCCCLELSCENVYVMAGYNCTKNLGCLIKNLVELLELSKEDGIRISGIRNVPIRIVLEGGWSSKCVGFGHFMKDRFVLTKEFAQETL